MMTHKKVFLLFLAIASCYASIMKEDILKASLKLMEDELHQFRDELTKYSKFQKPHEDKPEILRNAKDNSSYRYTCGFETDCKDDFEIEDTTPLKWELKLMSNNPQDRTEPFGHYMHARISRENKKDQYAYFTHDFTVIQPEQCGEFYYHMYNREGCDVARLLVTLQCEGFNQTEILIRETGSRENKWHLASFNIKKPVGSQCKLTWRVSKGLTHEGHVHIDEISMYYSSCRQDDEPVRPSQADCSFLEACLWTQKGPLRWHTGAWRTRTSNTGPNRYFGTYAPRSSGRYYYLEADDPNAQLQSSSIISPKMKTPIDQCMRFMYHMYGSDMGALKAIIHVNGTRNVLFSKAGDQGNRWHEGLIDLKANEVIQVELKGTIGNGSKSDIAIGPIKSQSGSCDKIRDTFGKCPGENCVFTDENCGEEIREIKHLEEIKVKRNGLLATIPKMAKEWELSFDVKLKSLVRGWTNLIRLTNTGDNCCDRGDRIPAIFLYPSNRRMHITNAIEWNGNWAYNYGYLRLNAYTTVKLEQKKNGNGDYIYKIFVGGQLKKQQRNRYPVEYRNVKVYASDDMYSPANAEMKNMVFKNLGQFDECKPICNKKLSDSAFTNLKPDPPKNYATKIALTPVKNSLKDTIPVIAKEWTLSFEIKPTESMRSWGNVIHFTATGNNCCNRKGDRIPAIWFRGRTTKLHICNSIEWNGNRCVDSSSLSLNKFTKIVLEQRKTGPKYRYVVTVGSQVILNITNSMPREYKNVKFYASDPWYTAAKCEIKNVEFKNLVPVYPCPNMCKGKEFDAIINGKTVKAVSYKKEQCNNRPYVYQVKVPNDIRTPRLSCLQFFYKLGPPKKSSIYCRFEVFYKSHRLMSLTKYEQEKWIKVSINVQQYIPFGTENAVIGVRYHIHDRCSDISFAGMQFRDGICN